MKIIEPFSKIRTTIVFLLTLVVFFLFIMQLMQVQVVDAQHYQDMVQGMTTATQPIKATRGEIVDRNGKPLVQNKMSYDVVFDQAFMPKGSTNETIAKLIVIFEGANHTWTDNLPISLETPFSYKENREEEIETLQRVKGVQHYAAADDIMVLLIEEYDLEEYPVALARQIAGVRYEMERRDFSLQTPYAFASDIDSTLVIQIKEHSFDLPGINVETNAVRSYPDDKIAPHILGLVGPLYKEEYDLLKEEDKIFLEAPDSYDARGYTMDDTIGKNGIEQAMESELRGHNGLREIQLDGEGQVVEVTERIAPIPGNTVVLTIDREMQKNAQNYLEAQIKYLAENEPIGRGAEANAGAVVVVNVKTGEILAAASYPYFGLEEYQTNYEEVAAREGKPLINRAILGEYTPGSIYKPVVALSGLNDEVITAETIFYCGGVYTYFAPEYTPQCLSVHNHISIHNALGWSCNIFFYETGRLTGIDSIDHTAKALGLGEETGIEIAEARGQRSNPAVKESLGRGEWYGADTIQVAIGQLDNRFSPLQLANYAATVANRGRRMKLTLVREVQSYNREDVVVPFEQKVAYEMTGFSEYSFDITIDGMINATTGSAGGTFAGYPISVASKTGTPQTSETTYNSTYIAFAPADDPEIAVCVVIENGWQGYTGAPVAKAIFDDYFGVDDHVSGVESGPQQLRRERLGASQEASDEYIQLPEPPESVSTQAEPLPPFDAVAVPEEPSVDNREEALETVENREDKMPDSTQRSRWPMVFRKFFVP